MHTLARGEGSVDLHGWLRLQDLRESYVAAYTALHNRYVLGPAGDDRKVALMRDRRVETLTTLAAVSILNRSELDGWNSAISSIRTCPDFHEELLADTPTCPHCGFHPVSMAEGTTVRDNNEPHSDRRWFVLSAASMHTFLPAVRHLPEGNSRRSSESKATHEHCTGCMRHDRFLAWRAIGILSKLLTPPTLLTYNYNKPVDVTAFRQTSERSE